MNRISQVAVVLVPFGGWFGGFWSGGTTLAVYWFETVATCLLVAARVGLHQRWNPRWGHFRYSGPDERRRGARGPSFVSGFLTVALAFSGAHAVFLGAVLLLLRANGVAGFAAVSWPSVGLGCLTAVAFLLLQFLTDLRTLRGWTFGRVERLADQSLSRVIVVHLTLVIGFFAIAVSDAPTAFFSVFVVLKTLAALSWVLPQYEPTTPPRWLSRVMNKVPNVHPGQRFEDFWARDRTQEKSRREANERPWP